MKIKGIKGFEWDEGNQNKNELKHGVTCIECEEIFHNEPFLIFEDPKHSKAEQRYFSFGKTREQRLLFVAFTIRKEKIRVISARPMSRKERLFYEKENSA